VVWAVCTTAYWGSFRLGELLPADTKHFDRFSALLGKDVRWEGEELKFTVRSPKVVGRGEETVLLVPVVGEISCPVRAVRKMERGVDQTQIPVRPKQHPNQGRRGKNLEEEL
jgi:hypothetical protein